MRVLTVRQPWAWAIIHGQKDVENRVRSLGPYRGPVAIHVAGAYATEGLDLDALDAACDAWCSEHGCARHPWTFDVGKVIGVVDLVGVHDDADCTDRSVRALSALYREDPKAFAALPDSGAGGVVGRVRPCSPWAMADHLHLELANPRPLASPIPARGRLGLWRPDDALLAAITSDLERAAP